MYVCDGGWIPRPRQENLPPPSHLTNPTQPPSCGVEKRAYRFGHSFFLDIFAYLTQPSPAQQQQRFLSSLLFFFSIVFLQKEISRFFFPTRKVIEGGYMPVLKEQGRPLIYICLDYFTFVRSVTQGPGAYL